MEKKIIMIGGSAGSYDMIVKILEVLPKDFQTPIVIILHRNEKFTTQIECNLSKKLRLKIEIGKDKDIILDNHIYFAAPGYHLLIEPDHTFSLDISEPVEFSRPAITVSFESAADVYSEALTLFVLSGANADGAKGMAYASNRGASCFIQDPNDALIPTMPQSALKVTPLAYRLTNYQLLDYFRNINNHQHETY